MRKFTIWLTCLLLFASMGVANAQTKVISGNVTGADDGMPIPGVTVMITGTTIGVTTDLDGNYTLSVPVDAQTLSFSFVGMVRQEIEIGNQTVINIRLETASTALNEVVVTALGISREKKSLGYSVQTLGAEAVNEVRESNFVKSLSGRVAGVSIKSPNTMGGSANVVIRGSASLTQNNQALFVIDGVPISNQNTNSGNQTSGWGGYDYGNAASDINPDDIESISILKGAAATALYGSRAANGVIEIKTKRGKVRGDRIGITINSGVTFSIIDKSSMPKQQMKYGGGYGAFYEDATAYFFETDLDGDGVLDLIAPTSEDASWGAKFDPNLSVIHWDALDPSKANFGEKRPWIAPENDMYYFFSTGIKLTNSVALEGGSDRGSFRLSYTNVDEKGILPNSSIKRHTLNFSSDYDLNNRLKAEANITYTNGYALGRYGTGYDGLNVMQSFGQWFQVNVDFKRLEDNYLRSNGRQLSWNSAYYNDLHPIYFDNPYWVRYKNYQDDKRNRVFGFAALTYKFNDWLNLKYKVSLDSYTETQNERISMYSNGTSDFTTQWRQNQEVNYDLMLNFQKRFGDISLNGLVGTNVRRNTYMRITGSTVGGLIVPDLWSVNNSVAPKSVGEYTGFTGTNSVFASVSVGYKDFLYLDITDRYDVSSTLPTGGNGFNYYSVSTAFLLSELDAFKNISFLSFAKIRANYAEVGNDAPAYSLLSTYGQGTSWGSNALFSVNSTLQNPNLRPERTKSFEIGLEANFFDNRVRLDLAYYNNKSIDQLMPVQVSPLSGYSSMWLNSGEVENKGIEVTLAATVLKSKDFTWDVTVNWFKNRNKVIRLFKNEDGEEVDNLLIFSQWDVSINAKVGEPYGVIRGSNYVYTNGEPTVGDNGYYKELEDENGVVVLDAIIGNIQPDWNMGISSRMKYKGFTFNVLFDFQKGGQVYSVNTKYGQATGVYEETAGLNVLGNETRANVISKTDGDKGPDFGGGIPLSDAAATSGGIILPGVKADGTANDILINAGRWGRAFYYGNSPTARFIFDASYIKLREMSIGYNLPKNLVEKTPFASIHFSVVGRNLAILHKNTKHFDPEAGLSSGNKQGIESGAYPTTRDIGFNLKLGI